MKALLNHHKAFLRLRRYQINGKNVCFKYSNLLPPPLQSNLNLGASIRFYETRFSPFNTICYRSICTSSANYEKSSSKVEDAVNSLKEAEREKSNEAKSAAAATEVDAANVTKSTSSTVNNSHQQMASLKQTEIVSTTAKKTILQKIWSEMVHYYHGFRLLFIDINVSRKLLWKLLNGDSLSRREHRLLIRTTSDLFRLLPFSVFIIVPFMELLLPLAIKLFPGMLPSTFQSATNEDKEIKQNLKVKIEMAKFLQKTLDDMSVQHKNHRSESAKEFSEFFQRVRTSGGVATNDEIMKFSKLFEDEITLDSLNRQQILALCRVLEGNTLGTTQILRFQLRLKLRSLAADDRTIQKEGIDALNLQELQLACRARGMRAYGISNDTLKKQLLEWINLSLNEKVPPSLLLLSRALMMPDNVEVSEKLKATLAVLPETIGTQAKAAIGEREGKIDNKTKIEIIKEEQRRIKEEQEEEKEAKLEIKAKEQIKIADDLDDGAPIITSDTVIKEPLLIKAFKQDKKVSQNDKIEKELSTEDIKVLGDALESISQKKNLMIEKEEIKEIKEEIAEYEEDVQELQQIVDQKDEKLHMKESRAAKLLFKKVNSMISNLDKVLDDLERKEKEIKILGNEPAEVTEAVDAVIEEEAKRTEELVRIDEMMNAIRKLKKVSNESVLEHIENILGRMDDDCDGSLKVEDVLKVIETIGKENVNLKEKQLHEILDLIEKEQIIETEEKIGKAIKKEQEQRQIAKNEKKDDFEETEVKFLLRDNANELSNEGKKDNELDEKIKTVNEETVGKVMKVESTPGPLPISKDHQSDSKNKSV